MNATEADRLAGAVNRLRPDWPTTSLRTFIAKNLAERSYRDAAVALVWVATDENSQTPARVLEAGPWWKATTAGEPTHVAQSMRCPDHPAERAWSCKPCETQAGDVAAGLAKVRAVAATSTSRAKRRAKEEAS